VVSDSGDSVEEIVNQLESGSESEAERAKPTPAKKNRGVSFDNPGSFVPPKLQSEQSTAPPSKPKESFIKPPEPQPETPKKEESLFGNKDDVSVKKD
jgi:hypothetical protein